MKKFRIILLNVFVFLFVSNTLFASNKTYDSSKDFLEAEGNTCSVATNGCNTFSIVNGELGFSTMRYCENVKEEWSCKEEKENSNIIFCTMEYVPVCGINGQTYSNTCIAGENEILYTGECSDYVDVEVFQILENKYSNLGEELSEYSNDTLKNVLFKIDELIKITKFSEVSLEKQKLKITKLYFIKRAILEIGD